MWQPSRQITGLQPVRKPLLHASKEMYIELKKPSRQFRKKVLPGFVFLSS
jgi:hypothetical protein